MSQQPDDGPPPAAVPPGARQVTIRRAPRYRAFVLTGAVAGVLVALVLTRVFPETGQFSARAVLGYLGVGLGLIGAVLGGLLAVFVERPRRRR